MEGDVSATLAGPSDLTHDHHASSPVMEVSRCVYFLVLYLVIHKLPVVVLRLQISMKILQNTLR